jgi:hypothetical protein
LSKYEIAASVSNVALIAVIVKSPFLSVILKKSSSQICLEVGEVNSEYCVFPFVLFSIRQISKVKEYRKKLSLSTSPAGLQEYHT